MTSSSAFAEGDLKPRKLARLPPDEEIVISGITGRFPESYNMAELHENLMNKRDLITNDGRRWKLDHPEVPQRTGKLDDIDKFDALFFGVHFKQAHTMDPMCRVILEQAYEAIVDAGVNPKKLRNSRTGVFVGACFSESEKTWFYDKLKVNGFGITGCARSMLANRISYWLGVTGPSYTVDTACSSGLYAVENAYRAMREGLCDAAIVGAANLCLHPLVSMQFFKLGVLSTDGRCKTFDESADGYVRSEAISVVFLQKAKDAKRVYATLVHGKINCDGFKEQGVTFPSTLMQSTLLQEFYMECGIPPSIVNYIEAHGTGTRVGDPEEVNAIDKVFSPGRKTPLKIGSVKTNLGHSEPASGLCSIAKVIIAMESGIIPPNLNYKTPRQDVKSLVDGTVQVVSELTPWKGGYAGINSFGFGGANAHVLLKSNPKEKVNNGAPNDNLPRLVPMSGRTEEAVTKIIDYLNSRPVDVEYLALYYNIHSEEINGHLYRGYTILPPRGLPEKPIKENVAFPGIKRPVWFVYSGMGSQWAGMGEMLLQLPVFAEAIKKCDAALKPHGIDIFHVITNKEKTAFDNILNSFVGIAACQIGLTDVLRTLGIEPDYIIGHSVGELGCAYADGCFTAEQMILAAYSRGLASTETKIIHGSMAAVGLGNNDVKDLCPPDIDVACHNSAESSTISGPSESMKKFVAELTAKKIFAREVPCSNIPYHSRYIAPAGSKLFAYLKKVIPEPKARSSKWISSSVPKDKLNTPNALYSSAEYHTNNLLSPVLFEESSASIPKDAITIEIAPHGLLQAILRRSLPPTVTNIALTQRGHANNVEVLLQGIGKMFTVGMHPQVANIYPAVQFPVSRSTPMISPLIKWEHSDEWFVTSYKSQEKATSSERQVKISIKDSEFESINGHIIDGRNLFPATGYLDLVWESIGLMKGELYTEVSVVFEDVKFLRATNIPKDGIVEFTVTVQKGTGRFEIVEGSSAVVTGYIRETNNAPEEKMNAPITINESEEESMTTRDVYKELRLRGYQYTGLYRGIVSATTDGSRGHLKWSSDWISFMDTMLQMKILGTDTRSLFVPTSIKKLVIDTKLHLGQIQFGEVNKVFPCYVQKKYNAIVCGGIEILGLKASVISRKKPIGEPVLEEYKFVPHTDKNEVSLNELARLSTNICLENHLGIKIKTVELIDATDQLSPNDLLSPLVAESLGDMPLIQADVSIVSTKKYKDLPSAVVETDLKKIGADTNALLAMGHELLTKDRVDNLNLLLLAVKDNGFLLTQESTSDWDNFEKVALNAGLDVILEKKHGQKSVLLLKKSGKKSQTSSVVFVDNNNFGWIEDMKKVMSEEVEKKTSASNRVIFVGQGDFKNGLMGLVNCLRKEPGGEIVRGILIQDSKAPKFSLEHPLYAKQLEKDLAVCVLRENRVWGSYRHLPLPPLEPKIVNHILADQKTRGDISSLNWHEGPLRTDLKPKNLAKVYYSTINFKDVMLASGKLAVETFTLDRLRQDVYLGLEYSGIDESGKRVMGLVESKAMTNIIVQDSHLFWEIPKEWSLEDAATVPCVYATCIYGLYKFGKMKRGDKILIHAGSGGVGQAAINLALHEGCEVFTTVGTPEKRKFIRDTYPQIPESHIGNSRDCSFEMMIIQETNNQGVDIVLNSLAEEKLQASVRCLAQSGRFLEIGKFDLAANNPLGMEVFLREVSFTGIMLDLIIGGPAPGKEELRNLFTEKLKTGAIKPLIRTIFPKEEIEAAYRYMAAGKHIGKVLLKIRDEKEANTSPFKALPRYYCYNDRSYIILGGLGGFGLELADYLVTRGAKKLVLTSRTGISNGYQKTRINVWQSYGVQVVVVVGKEASKLEDCKHILEAGAKLGSVDAIFNLAVVLKDALWDNQTIENFEESFKSKAWATQNLDDLSRKMCPHLRHFVVFSSVSCGRGNAGQTNYGMSNSVMERICEKRAAEGLPALAVQWGAVGDVGLVAEMQEDSKELVIGGTLQQRITSCLQELSEFLVQNKPVVSSMVVAEKRAGGDGALNVVDTVLNIMGLKDLKGVSPGTSLAELGMDSMMSVEIKQTLEREFEIFLTAQDIRNLNFSKLQEMNEQVENENVSSERTGDGEDLQGINLFMQLVGEHENINTVCLRLPSKAEQGRQEVFLIPGIEGLATIFGTITPHIKAPATCLQLGLEHKKTITQISNDFLSHVLERSKGRRQYTIVGYSYGSCIAIELMRLLESKGMVGQLILIDGAPDHVKQVIKEHMDYETKEELENNVILAITNLFAPTFTAQLSTDLKTCKSYDEKIEALLSRIPKGAFKIPEDDQRGLCRALYDRLVALENYDISNTKPIKAPIILLKPTLPSIRGGSEDYGLSKVTVGSIEIHYVEGNHVSILENEKVAAAINGETLENAQTFKKLIMDK